MFAAAYNRVDAIKLLARRGADVKATSKVVDLYELTREEAPHQRSCRHRWRRGGGGPRAGGQPAGGPAAAPAARPSVRRCRVSIAATTTPS